ncbi:MAG TPA: SDR family NAD(P)-dependent oxidoreductase [Candidatus Elarobacter sp.]|nr:SDR family NAD(P)-dependent oxidoreductase [Candidatus Elarobacter sp.]HEV2739013.1 SDR family NAD(P)-dependent oxidoreductase [Candidatus Elarobacter sp.]
MHTDRVVVITGAAGGMGEVLVDRFLANGDTVVYAKQDREALRDLRESLRDPGVVSDADFLDFAKESEIDNALVSWIRDGLAAPQTPAERAAFEREVQRSAPGRGDIRTFPDLLD